jgi:hypothetical protein
VVVGEPGAGKTSILWGMADRLCAQAGAEVFFVKATWLTPDERGSTRVGQDLLIEAIDAASGTGRPATLLVDTVDVLVNNDDSWTTLVTVVDDAVSRGASVIMTSRIAEAAELPPEWKRFPLYDYALPVGGGDLRDSEFGRAVVTHGRFFTRAPEARESVINDMLGIVARDLSLTPLCLRPLTLRMLFEIYNPGRVADVVDTTGLYEAFWNSRIVRDRRAWDHGGDTGGGDRDLSATTHVVALEMLRTGRPEVIVGSMTLPGGMTADQVETDLRALVRRGVGQYTENGVFQFFHQTFFEYAASRALVFGHGRAGIDALVARVQRERDDYFVLAVLEQTLLCAGRAREPADHAAAVLTGLLTRFAADLRDGQPTGPRTGGTAGSYGLCRVVLAVCAQSPLPGDEMTGPLTEVLAAKAFELPALRSFLQLLPSPARRFGRLDRDLLRAAAGRADNAWIAVVETLTRLLPRDRAAVPDAVRHAGLIDRVVAGDAELAHRGELRDFLVELLLWTPDEALTMLTEIATASLTADRAEYVALILARMTVLRATHPDLDWVGWADRIVGDATTSSAALIRHHAALHIPRLRALGFAELDRMFDSVTTRLTTAATPSTADRSLLGALLTVIGDRCPPDAAVDRFLASLTRVTVRERVRDLSLGWLVPLFDSSSPVGGAARNLAVDWLAAGMPTSTAETIGDTRAKVVRNALMRLELPPDRVADITGRAAAGWAARHPDVPAAPAALWTMRGGLLLLVVRAAAAGVPDATDALDRLRSSGGLASADLAAIMDAFYQHESTAAEMRVLTDLLLEIGEFHRALQLLDNGRSIDEQTLTRLRDRALATFRAAVPAERPRALSQQTRSRLRSLAKLLVRLDARTGGLPVGWPELAGWLDRTVDDAATAELVELAGAGLERKAYPTDEVLARLRALAAGPDVAAAPAGAARLWCVWWYAKYGGPHHAADLFRLAFTPPLDAKALIKASSFVFPDERETPLNADEALAVVLEMGRRLKGSGLGSARRKDVAKAWSAAMWRLVPGSPAPVQLTLVRALPDLDDPYAGHLVQMISPHRRPEVLDALHAVAAAPSAGQRLRRNVNEVLDRTRRHASDGGWPTLYRDLAETPE